ncbi:MAG: hypothetical protein ACLPGW_19660 [Roseiarcus sp.]
MRFAGFLGVIGLAMASSTPAAADECEAIAAGVAAATHLPAEPSGHNAFEFNMLGIHSRMYLFCGAPRTEISARDLAQRIPPPALITMASVASAQFAKDAPGNVYSAISDCVQQALRRADGIGNADAGAVAVSCVVTEDSSQIDVYPINDPVP